MKFRWKTVVIEVKRENQQRENRVSAQKWWNNKKEEEKVERRQTGKSRSVKK